METIERKQNKKQLFLLLALLIICGMSCKRTPPRSFSVPGMDAAAKPTVIRITKLAQDYKKYQGKYIETIGTFYQAFEQFAIVAQEDLTTADTKGFWLDLHKDLHIDNTYLDLISGEK